MDLNQESQWILRDKYNNDLSPEFFGDIKRLESGEPLAYIIGWQPFCGTKIYLDSRPLIPRPETEYWVNLAITEIKKVTNPRVLDLCAGSGCIGIAVLRAVSDATVDFGEIDESHHVTIRKNILENGINEHRVRILGGSLFENITDQYDFILTNPPYIDPKLSNRVQNSVAAYEPEKALFGGSGGMELIRAILTQIRQFLKPGGVLYVEHEPEQVQEIQGILPGVRSEKDQFGIMRFSRYQK